MLNAYYQNKQEVARRIYAAEPLVYSPFFNKDIALGTEGFDHLSRSARGARAQEEQVRRFILLPLAIRILKTATTAQEYRKRYMVVSTPGARRNRYGTTKVQWWAFVALFVRQEIKIRVVVRRVGGGKLHFWSVMLYNMTIPRRRARRRVMDQR